MMLFVQVSKKKVNWLISHQPVVSILHDICTLISCIKSLVLTQISQTHLNNSLLPLQIKIQPYSISRSISFQELAVVAVHCLTPNKFQFPISPALHRENSQIASLSSNSDCFSFPKHRYMRDALKQKEGNTLSITLASLDRTERLHFSVSKAPVQ